MKRRILCIVIAVVSVLLAAPLLAAAPVSIGIYVPGVAAGSPLYETMVAAAQKVAKENTNLTVKVVEGGFNQAKWPEKVMSMVATGSYDYILTSNPSLPAICQEVAKSYPKQKFIIMDSGVTKGIPNFYTVMYNQVEQGYIAGYLAGLVTTGTMNGANADLKIGAIVAQEYPALTQEMIPGYEQGAQAINAKIALDYRIIGNWYDATKGADLANSMIDAGVDVILAICGGASQGVIKAAKARGKYVIYFDSDQYALAPGTIIGCVTLDQTKAVYDAVTKAAKGTLTLGTALVVDVKDGYVDMADKNVLYTNSVSLDIRNKMTALMGKFRSGGLALPIPQM